MEKTVKIIFHIDMNAFFATCAMIKEPFLKDKVFAIGGPSGTTNRGVLSTASYQARKLGIHAGMSVANALKIYPKLLIVPTDFNLYREKAAQFFKLLAEYTPLVLQASIDEAYLDVTQLAQIKHPLRIAQEIQTRLLNEYQLPSSIGIAPTLFLAKMGSDLKKPMGITVIRRRDVAKLLFGLDVADIYGIGKKTAPRLYDEGINTIADFMASTNEAKVLKVLSKQHYDDLKQAILGYSSDVVDPNKYAISKSISGETTFPTLITQTPVILEALRHQLKRVCRRLVKEDMLTRTIGIKLKYDNFNTINRSITLFDYTDDEVVLYEEIENLVHLHYNEEPLRLVGVFAQNLILRDVYLSSYDLFTYQRLLKKENK